MGIYKKQYLLGDLFKKLSDDSFYWVVGIQWLSSSGLNYILIPNDPDSKHSIIVPQNKIINTNIWKLVKRISAINNEVLCNLCPLRNINIINNKCSNICNIQNDRPYYYYVGDKIKFYRYDWTSEISAIALYDATKFFDYPLINNDNNSLNIVTTPERRLLLCNNLSKGFIGNINYFYRNNNNNNRLLDIENKCYLYIRTTYSCLDKIPELFCELCLDKKNCNSCKNSQKLWLGL